MDFLAYIIVRVAIGFLNLLPLELRYQLVYLALRLANFAIPRMRKVSLRNLEAAFPEKDLAWREETFLLSMRNLARTIVDFARMHTLDKDWIARNVEDNYSRAFEELRSKHPDKGILMPTGHLGSFELLAHIVALTTRPISFVMRPFKLRRLDQWWRDKRAANGNHSIVRKGAYKDVIAGLKSGRDIAVLFDQNVTINYAVFVDFFGKPAATTKILALAALRTKAPVLVMSIKHLGGDRYRANGAPCDLEPIYSDRSLSTQEKIERITQAISLEYEKAIRADPPAWFWIHNRWKTQPGDAAVPEDEGAEESGAQESAV